MAKRKKKENYDAMASSHPVLCPDSKYRWVYDVPMLNNPSILFDVYWVLAISFGIVYLFNMVIMCCTGNASLEMAWNFLEMFVLLTLFFFVLGYIAYFFVAWYYGWKYSVLFVMDEKEVVHKQLKSTIHKARTIGKLTAMAGAASGKPGMVGMGILAATRTSMTTTLSGVRRVIPCRRMNLIKVNQLLSRNRVYCADEDFDFVYQFLCDHCPNAKKKK
jgi:hypothetical protein